MGVYSTTPCDLFGNVDVFPAASTVDAGTWWDVHRALYASISPPTSRALVWAEPFAEGRLIR